MRKILKPVVFTTALLIGSTSAFAGAGHDHSAGGHSHEKITENQALVTAKSKINSLIKKETLDKSWENVDASKVEKKTFGNSQEWVVSFTNPKVQDVAKQTLYVFVSLTGEVTGANYSGK